MVVRHDVDLHVRERNKPKKTKGSADGNRRKLPVGSQSLERGLAILEMIESVDG